LATDSRPPFAASQTNDSPLVYVLHPGDLALAFDGERLETLLGSCVSVVLTDPHRTVGAMCHIVNAIEPGPTQKNDTAFASAAMRQMFAKLRSVGIEPRLCHAYVFGGGNMFPKMFNTRHVGEANVEWVMKFLRQHRIPVLAESVGGNFYRKVAWTVGSPELQVETVATLDDE
jgi:chemotaxis protein CheD